MTREHKYRGKSTDTGEWFYGYYMEIAFCDGQAPGLHHRKGA